ncbi:hypothetical protein [uncultured Tateyamaria sp.]|uniref:hypothetical protein n=1 Tax=uncultured Tateyamaria sp. TaxID=455651 RepID=UPI00262CAB12|nr:hypothetical protein [uncultured Tateyamaria sp.]
MPRSVLITTATLVLIAALGGYWLGQRQITADAAGVIAAVARVHGGDPAACVGWPGEGAVVMHVNCAGVVYVVDRFGRITRMAEEGI